LTGSTFLCFFLAAPDRFSASSGDPGDLFCTMEAGAEAEAAAALAAILLLRIFC
jgi:hypothetical protein